MKTCPICHEPFEDELRFCTFDGALLTARTRASHAGADSVVALSSEEYGRGGGNGWKIAVFVLLALMIAGGAVAGAYFYLDRQNRVHDPLPSRSPVPEPASTAAITKTESVTKPPMLAELTRQDLMERLPANLLRRFHMGEPGQGTPDDLRIVSAEKTEYVVLLGSGRLEGSSRTPVERILILKYEEGEFHDNTRQLLPAAYGSGAIAGRGAQVKFDEGGNNISVREAASSNSVVQECASCDRAFQIATLEWKGGRYVEAARVWENDRYTVFYVVADALEKRRVDSRARPFIDTALDPIIAQGFSRNGKEGWTVEWRGDGDDETAGYELGNHTERLIITVAKVKERWKAVQITD